jgi:hypothetical protein
VSSQEKTLREQLCQYLSERCADPNTAWPYHPRVGIGGALTDLLLLTLCSRSPDFSAAVDSGQVVLSRRTAIGGRRRQKRIDLIIETRTSLVAIEAKACMTAHSKALSRLVAELTSSLDAVLDASARAQLFVIVATNHGSAFTSPLNLPGPNLHDTADASSFVAALNRSLSNNPEIAGSLFIPITFDNETYCHPAIEANDSYGAQERDFISKILAAAGR